jgi:anti-sigma regulatory factor (Ser/Thr protein kinase)
VGDWPLQTRLCLGALPGAVSCARLHCRNVLWEWGLNGLADDAEVVASELVTNGVLASQRQAFRSFSSGSSTAPTPVCFALSSNRNAVVVQVWDANPDPPAAKNAELDADGGRGLLIVRALAETWGWYRVDGTGGKVVWARLRVTPTPVSETPRIGERHVAEAERWARGGVG